MLENFVASLAPKSFNLERYLAKSDQIRKINTNVANIIERKLDDEYSYSEREGILTSAYACNGTIVTIHNSSLAKALYTAVTSEGFNERLNTAYTHIKCFSDMKFFINKKKKEVSFVYYNCHLDRSTDFLGKAYDNLLELISLFSTSEYTVCVDYYKLFHMFLLSYRQTSFLTSFFTSIVDDEYNYSADELRRIVDCFLSYDKLSFQLYTQVPGMYLNHVDKFFEDSVLPQNMHINILRYIHDKNAFNSYHDFFKQPDTPNVPKALENIETYNFIFDEEAFQASSILSSSTEELVTWRVEATHNITKYAVLKIKDIEHADVYLDNIYACFKSDFLDTATIVTNATKSAIYLVFNLKSASSLEYKVSTDECATITKIMQSISEREWNFSFKSTAPLLNCFYAINSNIYLNPLYIDQLDFGNVDKALDYKLIILRIIEEFVKSKRLNVNNIYAYSFMKILPPVFAKNVISYLESGKFLDENTDTWGDVLTFEKLSNIRFLHNLNRLSPDFMTFFPCVHSDSRVQQIISKKSKHLENDYINSPECLQYMSNIGLELTDATLEKIFETSKDFYLHPAKVIVSKDLCISNSYQIVGVVWNECCLTTIGKLIEDDMVDTTVFYKLLSSLLYIQRNHNWEIDESNICQMLVDTDYHVFLNRNGLKHSQYNDRVAPEVLFNNLFDALNCHRNKNMPFEYFKYSELYDNGNRSISYDVLLCKEHNLYYIDGSLCPECRKIYCIIDRFSPSYLYGDYSWRFCRVDYKNSMLATNYGTPFNPFVIKQCKLGIENGLYDKYFFKPNSLALKNDIVSGVMFFNWADFNFDDLLPISVFNSRQRLQVVQVMYKKLLPLILEGACITNNEDFFESIAMHKNYKGELFILKIPFMNCEAILAKDQHAMELTKLTFAMFLISYIKGDTLLNAALSVKGSILCDLIEDIEALKFSESILEDSISAFCDVHNFPFSNKNKLCPLCLSDGISTDDVIVFPHKYFKGLQKKQPLFEGGEATLYSYTDEQIQKLFKPGVDLALKSKVIGKAIQKRNQFKSFNDEHTDIKFITIDKVQYESNGNTIKLKGFVQEKILDAFKISCLKDKEFVSSHGYTRYDIAEILIKVCIGIEFLHSIGGYIGDLNGGNILIRDKTVYFIDMDGMSFDDVKNFVYTDLYIYPPSAENKNITKDDDWYSLAIQAFYYFTYSHPFRGISDSKLLPPDEITRMKYGKSVLGNHGIKVPNISIGWDFFPTELIQFFKSTFEGNKRESMRNILEQFKTSLDVSENDKEMIFTEVLRSSPCSFALSYNTYIDTSGYLLWCERRLLRFSSGTITCKITSDYIILTTPNSSVILNDSNGHFSIFSSLTKDDKVYAVNKKLYYISALEHNVHVKRISNRSQRELDEIVVDSSTLVPFDFLVTDERKFIFLVKNGYFVDIYCNLEKLTSVDASAYGDSFQSHMFYDGKSGNYLVLLSGCHKTVGVLISSNGSYTEFYLNEEVSKSNCFYMNTLYYMIGDTIYFYNVIDGTQKKFPSQFAASGCLIERKANRFVICSKDKTYMYVKS